MPKIKAVIANDCSVQAVETINRNISENGVENLVKAVNHDAVYVINYYYYCLFARRIHH